MKWSDYAPSPKMARVLFGGLLTWVLIMVLRSAGVDITDAVASVAPVIVAGVWGWAKAEPKPDSTVTFTDVP